MNLGLYNALIFCSYEIGCAMDFRYGSSSSLKLLRGDWVFDRDNDLCTCYCVGLA